MPNCLICQLASEKGKTASLVYRNHQVLLWQNMEVNLPGYFIIAPIRHITLYHELTEIEAQQLCQVTKQVTAILHEKYGAEKIYQCCFGELVPHLHFHLFPRYPWMKEIKETQVNGCIDGLKLCSFIRENYLVGDDQEKRADLKDYVSDFKKQMCEQRGEIS